MTVWLFLGVRLLHKVKKQCKHKQVQARRRADSRFQICSMASASGERAGREDQGRNRRAAKFIRSSLRVSEDSLWGLCSYCLRLFGQQRTTRANCESREPEVVRRSPLRFLRCCSSTDPRVMRAAFQCLPELCVSMRDAQPGDGECGADGWSSSGPSAESMVQPGGLGN